MAAAYILLGHFIQLETFISRNYNATGCLLLSLISEAYSMVAAMARAMTSRYRAGHI